MTPKEKALQLVEKFSLVGLQQRQEGIACALIAVDEILYFMDMFNLDLEMTHQHKWWQQVKIEIENL
jgi:hypothetical protein